ncbi:MAG: HAMP domain-containing sensor histidine kinase [Pseudomonadota bacterium]
MRLARFIRENIETILQEWEDFAVSLHTLAAANKQKLRDHAEQMLMVICTDLDTHQDEQDSVDKSKGKAPAVAKDTAAETHAEDRLHSGFTIEELTAEYRAMRASVLRLWQRREKGADELAVQDMLRFNEAIDQALTESVARYSSMMRDSQNVFLAILGHDVRNPLGAIRMGAQYLLLDEALPERYHTVAARIVGSTKRVTEIVSDLIDYSTGNLGSGMPIKPVAMDFAPECHQVVDEIRALHPDRAVELDVSGDMHVVWDGARMTQALSNLVANAVQHGKGGHPVWVTVKGGDDVVISVQNMGAAIEPSRMRAMFDPAQHFAIRSASERSGSDADNLGLGLYIAREIVTAHGGTISVTSTESAGTSFTVTLPRAATAAAA